jgi:hypothetical protein
MLGSAAEAETCARRWVRWQTADRSLFECRGIPRDHGHTAGDQRHTVGRARRETHRSWLRSQSTRAPTLDWERNEQAAGSGGRGIAGETDAYGTGHILREAFDYPYRDIANRLKRNARQVVTALGSTSLVAEDRASSTEWNVFSMSSLRPPKGATSAA